MHTCVFLTFIPLPKLGLGTLELYIPCPVVFISMYGCMFVCFYLVLYSNPFVTTCHVLCGQTADLASANASEEDKVKAMMNQSSKDFDPSRYVHAHQIAYDIQAFRLSLS